MRPAANRNHSTVFIHSKMHSTPTSHRSQQPPSLPSMSPTYFVSTHITVSPPLPCIAWKTTFSYRPDLTWHLPPDFLTRGRETKASVPSMMTSWIVTVPSQGRGHGGSSGGFRSGGGSGSGSRGPRRFKRRQARFVATCRKVLKRSKESQSRFSDLFTGNYLFLRVNPPHLKAFFFSRNPMKFIRPPLECLQ